MKLIIENFKRFLKEMNELHPLSTFSPEEQAGIDWEKEQAAGGVEWSAGFLDEALVPWLREFAPEDSWVWRKGGKSEGPVPPEIRQKQVIIIKNILTKVLNDLEESELHLMGTEERKQE